MRALMHVYHKRVRHPRFSTPHLSHVRNKRNQKQRLLKERLLRTVSLTQKISYKNWRITVQAVHCRSTINSKCGFSKECFAKDFRKRVWKSFWRIKQERSASQSTICTQSCCSKRTCPTNSGRSSTVSNITILLSESDFDFKAIRTAS